MGAIPADGGDLVRNALDRRAILTAAVSFIDRHSLHALTMRRLGAELGVEAMSLYRYVVSKDQLLDGIVDLVVDDLYGDPQVHMAGSDLAWQDYLQRLAHGVRRLALAHPEVFPLVATRPPAAPWVRPPLRSLRWMEDFLEAMYLAGFSDAGSVTAYRAFSSFLLGHLLLEVSALGVDTGPIDEADPDSPGIGDLSGYPRLHHLREELARDEAAGEFAEALESLLDRLEVVRTLRPAAS